MTACRAPGALESSIDTDNNSRAIAARKKRVRIYSRYRLMRTRLIVPSEHVIAKACLLTYACSLLLPAFHVVGHDTYVGFITLLFGWIFIFIDTGESLFFRLAWWANPLFCHAIGSLKSGRPAMTCISAFASLVLCASFILVKDTYVQGAAGQNLLEVRWGYFVWMAGILFILVAGVVKLRREQPSGLGRRHWFMLISTMVIGFSYIVLGQ